jgi:hypothetical protein
VLFFLFKVCALSDFQDIKVKAQVNPYDPVWEDYLKARWKRKQLSGVATRLINA